MDGFIEGFTQLRPKDSPITLERFEWRTLNRLLGFIDTGLEMSALADEQRAVLKKALAWFKRFRHCLHGDRYVLAGPTVQYAPMYDEDDNWEAYQHIARDGSMAVLQVFRCLSLEETRTWRLRGLEPTAVYHAESYNGLPERAYTGAELMYEGYSCTLPHTRCAEIVVLSRT
jgi:alpha-galactosidase